MTTQWKASDQAAAGTSLENITGLSVAITNGGIYVIQLLLYLQSDNTTLDYAFQWSLGGGSIDQQGGRFIATDDLGGHEALTSGSNNVSSDFTTQRNGPILVANRRHLFTFEGAIRCSGDGTLQAQFAKASASAVSMVAKAGSFLRVEAEA